MPNIGLFFGSFNPIHHGHLLVATHIREAAALDEIWFVVSPQNPFKQANELAPEQHRLQMVELAIEGTDYFHATAIEFHLPKPSYTYNTLQKLSAEFSQHQFKLIIGGDNVAKFPEWKEAEWIVKHHEVLVYNRAHTHETTTQDARLQFYNLPMFDLSATDIRHRVQQQQPIRYFVPENVEHYIRFHNLYR